MVHPKPQATPLSSVDQNTVRQLDGKDTARPKLDELVLFVRAGDVVLVHSKGVRVEFVKENLTFTGEDSPMATLLLSVMGRSPSPSAP